MGKRQAGRTGARRFIAVLAWTLGASIGALPAIAKATLNVTPLTWNVIGLDSNRPAAGPQHFPIGARVCSTSAASNVAVTLVWDSANAYVDTRPGSQSTVTIPAIAANGCADAYFEVEVTRDAAAFDTVRRYHITASDGVDTASTPTPRELYVEHLISQNRNAITAIKVNGVSIPAGGSVGMVVGNTYTVELDAGTATQGYGQFESFINLSNAIFRIDSVQTTYSADNSPYVPGPAPAINDKLYADACKWENNPASPNYRSCVGGDFKAGGNDVVTIYTITIIGGGGSSQTLSTLLYDFSGSSFHYNADFGTHAVIANVIDPTALGFTQQFTPASTTPGGTSTLTFAISNPNAAAVSGAGFSDTLPNLGGGQMVVASPATFSTVGCGSPAFAPTAGATTLAVSNATIPANGTCTISVLVSVPSAPTSGSYVNTSGNLIVGGLDTGRNTTANLGISATAPPTNICGLTLAQWTMQPAAGTSVPPAFSFKAGNVASAAATTGAGVTSTIDATIGDPVNSWSLNGFSTAATLTTANNDYVQFAVDTTDYTGITFAFDARLDTSLHGPKSLQLYSSTDGTSFTPYGSVLAPTNAFATYAPAVSGANASGITYFRIYGYNAGNNGADADLFLDNVKVGGCSTASPPTLVKSFSPSTVVVGGTSTLTFTLGNPNSAALTGAAFGDTFPAGMQVAAPPVASNSCGGTWAPAPGDTALAFANGTIPASGTCTLSVNVTATTPGTHGNVSGFVASAEGGTNATATGSAVATLQALVPPTIAAAIAPASVQVNGTAVLTFTLTNPNAAVTLSSVAFSENHPANLVNANPALPAVSNTCGGALTASPGGTGITLSGATIPAAGNCAISVPVTSAVTGTYLVTTSAVSDAAAGAGNTASASVDVTAPAPGSSVLKQVGTSATGPWFNFVAVAPGTPLYYRFTVENTGDVPLDPFGVSDPMLPQAASCAWQTPNSPSTLPVLPVASPTLDPTATCVVGPVFATLGATSNTATAQGTFSGSTFASIPSTADYIGAVPGFSLVKQVAASPLGPWASAIGVPAGGDVFYRFTLVNTGGLDLSGIAVTDVTLDLSSCTFTDPLVVGDATTCTVGPITAAGSAGTVIVNTATGHGSNGGSSVDTPPSTASFTISSANADLAIANDDGVGNVGAGGTTTYTVTVSNNGPDDVTGATVTDTAPAGLAFGAWTCAVTNPGSGGSVVSACGSPSGTGDLNTTVTLQPGAVVTFTIAAVVGSDATGSLTTTASVTAPAGVFDAVNANDSASDTDAVDVVTDLAIVVDDGVPSVVSGTTTSYTITVTNNGPASSAAALLTDPLAPGLAKSAVNCGAAPGQCVTPPTVAELESGAFVLPLMAPGATYQLQVVAQVTAATGSVTNIATVAPGAGSSDTNPANDVSSDIDLVTPAPVVADLSVTVTDGVSSVTAGAPVTYTITVSNAGPNGVTGATVSDVFPVELGPVTWTCTGSGGTCPPSGIGNLAASVDLPAGGFVTFTVTGTLSPAATGVLTDTASVSSAAIDPVPENNTATDTDLVIPVAPPPANDLAVVIDDGVATLDAGATTTYRITVTNNGLSTISGAILSVPVAPGIVKTAVACAAVPGQCVTASTIAELDSGTFALPALAPAATYALDVSAQVTIPFGVVANTASVAMPVGVIDAVPANDSATDVDVINASPPGSVDVGIGVDDGVTVVNPGAPVTYTITVNNAGASNAVGVAVNDVFPAELGTVAWNCAAFLGGLCPETAGTGDIDATVNLPAGSFVVFTVTGTLSPGASGTLVDTATATVLATDTDTQPANNTATDTDTITPVVVSADLGVAIDDGVTTVTSGTATSYTVTVVNNGPSPVTGAILADPAVAGLAKTAIACAAVPGQCVTPPTVSELESATFALPALAPAQTYAIVVTANVSAVAGSVTNVAAVAAPGGVMDAVPGNDSASDTDTVLPPLPTQADLGITVSASAGSVAPGGNVSYTITVTNGGPADVTNATVSDVAPSGVTFESWTCLVTNPGSGGSVTTACGAPSGTGNLATNVTMQPGSVIRYVIAASVAPGASGNVVDSASVGVPSGTTDPNVANNASTVAVSVQVVPPTIVTQSIPTLSEWSLIALSLLVLGVAGRAMRGRLRQD
jgi:uncharacterized repeat protein (TIGR01451 family)